jgi:hypothetical protein
VSFRQLRKQQYVREKIFLSVPYLLAIANRRLVGLPRGDLHHVFICRPTRKLFEFILFEKFPGIHWLFSNIGFYATDLPAI